MHVLQVLTTRLPHHQQFATACRLVSYIKLPMHMIGILVVRLWDVRFFQDLVQGSYKALCACYKHHPRHRHGLVCDCSLCSDW